MEGKFTMASKNYIFTYFYLDGKYYNRGNLVGCGITEGSIIILQNNIILSYKICSDLFQLKMYFIYFSSFDNLLVFLMVYMDSVSSDVLQCTQHCQRPQFVISDVMCWCSGFSGINQIKLPCKT